MIEKLKTPCSARYSRALVSTAGVPRMTAERVSVSRRALGTGITSGNS
jgi:hypothetical protein